MGNLNSKLALGTLPEGSAHKRSARAVGRRRESIAHMGNTSQDCASPSPPPRMYRKERTD